MLLKKVTRGDLCYFCYFCTSLEVSQDVAWVLLIPNFAENHEKLHCNLTDTDIGFYKEVSKSCMWLSELIPTFVKLTEKLRCNNLNDTDTNFCRKRQKVTCTLTGTGVITI